MIRTFLITTALGLCAATAFATVTPTSHDAAVMVALASPPQVLNLPHHVVLQPCNTEDCSDTQQ